MALLHSFWYDEALKAFTEITVTDPNCAMAYWGIAMSLYYPLWQPPDTTALKKGLAAIEHAKRLGAKTSREQAYIEAIETFYKNFETLDHRTRALAYEKAMEQISRRYPEDPEAAIFYGLALNGTALPTDKTYSNQKAAGEILAKVFTEQPDHPGIAHYIIHSYDSPPLASRALPAARRYAKIAPSSPHALHMPSHIFIRLGLWPESIESNRASAVAAKEHVTRTRPGAASFDELHAIDYLMYAYLQGAQDREAKRLLDALNAMERVDVENFAAAYAFAAVPARWTLERRRWSEAATLTLHPSSFPWNRFPWTEAIVYFARALGATRSGDLARAQTDVAKLQSLHQALVDTKQAYWADQVEILRRAAAAWLAHAKSQHAEALTLMRSAADLEDATEKHPVTPGAIVPARELLGDLLLELNEPKQALREFETSLTASPNRLNGLYGAARAAELIGETQKARHYYTQLMTNCDRADNEIPALQQAKTFLTKK
ncbi:MAG: hypothetical protein HY710_15885 [Candidatus Latescibacteria bacterium]|nr:hypothetical protein [Candidatus Latescibacterota bacterium]